MKRKLGKQILFTIAPKIIKYSEINLAKEVEDWYAENYKTLMKTGHYKTEENIGRTCFGINHSKIFFDPPPRVMEIKTKINK